MTKLDQHVKGSMLTYPSIFPTRLAVLAHLFLVLGNGYNWYNGVLEDRCGDDKPATQMDYSDLDKRDDTLEHIFGDRLEIMAEINAERKARDDLERASRQEREKHIDMLAARVDPDGKLHGGHYYEPKNIVSLTNSGYLFGKFPKDVEPSYRAGAVETLDAVLRSGDGTEEEIACVTIIRDAIRDNRDIPNPVEAPELAKPKDGWYYLDRLKGALENEGFVKNSDATNGAGVVTHYDAKPLSIMGMSGLGQHLEDHGFKGGALHWEGVTGRYWENGEHDVSMALICVGDDRYRVVTKIVSHPDDPGHFLDALDRHFQENIG